MNASAKGSGHIESTTRLSVAGQGQLAEDIHLFNEKLREWEDYYNYHVRTVPSTATHRHAG